VDVLVERCVGLDVVLVPQTQTIHARSVHPPSWPAVLDVLGETVMIMQEVDDVGREPVIDERRSQIGLLPRIQVALQNDHRVSLGSNVCPPLSVGLGQASRGAGQQEELARLLCPAIQDQPGGVIRHDRPTNPGKPAPHLVLDALLWTRERLGRDVESGDGGG
jgi:hypothetical protein